MKNLICFTTFLLITSHLFAQSIERDVVASSGDYFENANGSLSWTLGELATETYISGNAILTQGFQQPGDMLQGFALDLKVLLDGPYIGPNMSTTLNSSGYVPLNQPYNVAPWSYNGTEAVVSIPNVNVVDWILIELRDAVDVPSATSATIIETQAGFLLNNGTIVGIDGSSMLQSAATVTQGLFVVIWHRHHLGIMSANPLIESGGVYSYDFSTGSGQVAGGFLGYKELAAGIWGMVGGDGNADKQVNNADKLDVWAVQAGLGGYRQGDFNMDAQVNNLDKIDIWAVNSGYGGQVPADAYKSGIPD